MGSGSSPFEAGVVDAKSVSGTVAVLSFLFLSAVSAFTHIFGHPVVTLILAPLPLLLLKFDAFNFYCLYAACNLFFFATTNSYIFQTTDACLFVFLAMYFFNRDRIFSLSVPRNSLLLFFYVFLAYIFIMAIGPLQTEGLDFWLLYDMKKYLILSLAAFFCTLPIFGPKKITLILLVTITFTALHGSTVVVNFILSQARQMTWNEIYYGNMSIVGIVLLGMVKNMKLKIFLGLAVLITVIGMLAAQTRSIWISTTLCIAVYLMTFFWSKLKKLEIRKIITIVGVIFLFFLLTEILMRLFLHTNLMFFIVKRMTPSNNELINPFASLGYRLYESYMVWRQRSMWGHGTGAYLYLVLPQLPYEKFAYWPSIHCEYMEILFKWGFFGLGLYGIFIGVFLKQSLQLFFSKKKFISSLGAIAFLTILNTLITAITSGYLFRVNMLMWDILMIGMVIYYTKRVSEKKQG